MQLIETIRTGLVKILSPNPTAINERTIAPTDKKSATTFESLEQHFSRLSGGRASSVLNGTQDYLNAYHLNEYISNQISVIAADISRLKYRLVDRNGVDRIDHAFDFLFLTQFCSGLNFREFIELAVKHYLLDGNIFVTWFRENASEERSGVLHAHLINPADVKIYDNFGQLISSTTRTSGGGVKFFQTQIGPNIYNIEPEYMLHSKSVSPHNTFRGMGVVQRNMPTLEQSQMQSIFNRMFFQNDAQIPFFIMLKEQMSPIQFKRFTDEFNSKHSGPQNIGKFGVLPFPGDIKEMQMSHNDMQMIEQKQLTKKDVRDMFQVPSIRTGGDEARYDSATEQMEMYHEVVLPSYYCAIEELITRIMAVVKKTELRFEFIPPKTVSAKTLPQAFAAGAITPNEYREAINLPRQSDERLDNYFLPANLAPIDQILTATTAAPIQQQTAVAGPEKIGKIGIADEIKAGRVSRYIQMTIHKRAARTKKRATILITRSVNQYYQGLKKRVMSALDSQKSIDSKSDNDLFDLGDEISKAKRASKSFFRSTVVLAIADVNELLDTEVDSSSKNKRLNLVVEKLSSNYASTTLDSRRDEIRELLSKAQEEGVPISEIRGRFQDYFSELTGEGSWKALRIARTESGYAWDQAGLMGYDELGIDKFDVIGCEDNVGDCNAVGLSREEADNLNTHPNHTGTLVPGKG